MLAGKQEFREHLRDFNIKKKKTVRICCPSAVPQPTNSCVNTEPPGWAVLTRHPERAAEGHWPWLSGASTHTASPPLPLVSTHVPGLCAAPLGCGFPQTSLLLPAALLPLDLRLSLLTPLAPRPAFPHLSAPDQPVLFILLIQNFGSNGTIKNQTFWAMSINSFKYPQCSRRSCGAVSMWPTLVHSVLTAELPSHYPRLQLRTLKRREVRELAGN